MGHHPAISVVVPVYNKGDGLSRCLDGMLAQTFDDFEVICVDDCSCDGSIGVLEKYAAADTRIRVLRNDQNQGVGATRNRGLDEARGKYVTFVDADDSLRADALERAYGQGCAVDADMVVYDLAFCHSGREDASDAPVSLFLSYLPPDHGDPFTCDIAGVNAFLFTGASACTKLFSRTLIEDLGVRFTDHPIAEDLLFTYTLLANAARITAIEAPLYRYELGTGSGNEVNVDNILVLVDVFSELQERLSSHGLFERHRDAFVNLACGHFDNMLRAAADAASLKRVFDAISAWLRPNADIVAASASPVFANDNYAAIFRYARKGDFAGYLATRFDDLQRTLAAERETSKALKQQLEAAQSHASSAIAEVEALRTSHSYKLGNLIMKVPSKAKRALKKDG